MTSDAARWGPDVPTPAQLKEFHAQVETGRITKDALQRFLRYEDLSVMMPEMREAAQLIVGGREKAAKSVADWFAFWTALYHDHFGIKLDTANLRIPEQKSGFNQLIVVAKDLTPNRIFAVMKRLFPIWRSVDDLDTITSVRKTDAAYAIWCRDRVEADEEFVNKSACDLERGGVDRMTLEERLLLEIMYFILAGEHLDLKNWTLCAGSRCPGGAVPWVGWSPAHGGVSVDSAYPGSRYGGIRAREAVFV